MTLAKKLNAPTGKPVSVRNNLGAGSRGSFSTDSDEPKQYKAPRYKDQASTTRLPGNKNPWPRH